MSEVTGLDPKALDKAQAFTIKGTYVYSSAFVDAAGAEAAPSNFLASKPMTYTITYTPPAPPKTTK